MTALPGKQSVLVVEGAGTVARDDLRPELTPFSVRFVSTDEDAHRLLLNASIGLLIAAPSVSTSRLDGLLERVRLSRPSLFVLLILKRQASERRGWARREVGVLRWPLVPGALSRTVALLLSLRQGFKQ